MTEDLNPSFKGAKTWHGTLISKRSSLSRPAGVWFAVLGILPCAPLGIPALRQWAGTV